jgi:single-strand DNA-binding protein
MASRTVNKVTLLGHLGKDAETKFTQSGTAVSNFTVATNRRWKDQQTGEWKEETEWHRCVLWRSENVSNYLQKGKQVFIEGRLQTRSFDDREREGQKRYITEVVCEDLILLGGRGEAPSGDFSQQAPPARQAQKPQAPPEEFNQAISDDDVPF